MASIIIRRLEDDLKLRLRIRAAEHNRSMEEEARVILRMGLSTPEPAQPRNAYDAIRRHVEPFGGVALEIPTRDEPVRDPPTFD